MDKTTAMVAIFGIAGVVLVAWAVAWGVVEAAKHQRRAESADGSLPDAIRAVGDGLDQVRQQVAELQERVDFAERLLAQGRVPEQLPRS